MLGGLARRVELVEKICSKGSNCLVVDSGDLFFQKKVDADLKKNQAKAQVLARAYKKMGVAAVNVGDLDLLLGVEFLKGLEGEGLPLISANLAEASTGKLLFPAQRVIHRGSLKIAMVGLMGPELDPQVRQAVGENVSVLDPWNAARKTVEGLKGKVDLVVVLSDMGMARDQRLATEIPGIQLILGGHDGRFLSSPHREGSTWIFQSYQKGMYLGRLTLQWQDPSGPIRDEARTSRLQHELVRLEGRIKAHEKAKLDSRSPSVDRSLKQLMEQRSKVEQELLEAQKESGRGNRFSWRLEPLEPSLPENKEVSGWIQEAQIHSD